MERFFINANFKYVRVVPIHNGVSWTIPQICQRITTSYLAFNAPTEVVVWLDREGRQQTASSIRDEILECLHRVGVLQGQAHVLVNDKMSENIILSDNDVIAAEFDQEDYQYSYEGCGGKRVISDMFRSIGINYKEMKHGPYLLKKIRLSRCAQNSACVAEFLQTFDRQCWWV